MKRKFVAFLTTIFALAATCLIIIQYYQTQRTATLSDNMFNISVNNAMDDVIIQLRNPEPSSGAERGINFQLLDSLITQELIVNGVDLSPEVGIMSPDLGEVLYCSAPGKERRMVNSPYKYSVEAHTGSPVEYYIVLFFSSAALFLQANAHIYMVMSTFLIIIILLLFIISMRIIANQRKVDEMKTDFINNMTHEIKTPIATIGLACEMLSDPSVNSDSSTRSNFVNIINDENRRMRVLIETILQNAKMSNKNFNISPKEIDLNNIINETVKSFALTLKNRNGSITADLKADPALLYADELHITNMIYNLVDNAIKYSPNEPTIHITTLNEGDFVVLKIKDNGIGISKEDQKHIFEKFYRVSTGNVHNVKGFGIGLNYVSQVVTLHHGKISLQSELGQGTTFSISIPQNA